MLLFLHCRFLETMLVHAATPRFLIPCCAACSHGIVSTSVGPEYYVSILSFVDKTQLEPGCSVLLHNKVRAALGQRMCCCAGDGELSW
jgi:ATP-dependent 26S proteasome regulatory subunit